jgi:hypothetical protein
MMTQSHQSIITERFCSRYSTGKDFYSKKLRNKSRKLPLRLAFATFAFVFAPLAFKL